MVKKVKKIFIAVCGDTVPMVVGHGETVELAYKELQEQVADLSDEATLVEDCNFYIAMPIEVKSKIEVVHVPVWDSSES